MESQPSGTDHRKGAARRTSNQEGQAEASGSVSPEKDREGLSLGVERNVRVRTLGVVVGRYHLGAGGVEASAAGDLGGRTDGCAGEHLERGGVFSFERFKVYVQQRWHRL